MTKKQDSRVCHVFLNQIWTGHRTGLYTPDVCIIKFFNDLLGTAEMCLNEVLYAPCHLVAEQYHVV